VSEPHPRRARVLPLLAALPAVASLCLQFALLRPVFVDDSYIFYRYAQNWADGLGPVFNRGEHVEGFSSFLWTALLAAAAKLGIDPADAGPALALALAITLLVLLAFVAHRLLGSVVLTVAVPLALTACAGFWFYAATGMDTTAFALVLLVSVTLVARHVDAVRSEVASRATMVAAAAALVALVLVRAEGPMYAIGVGLAAAWLTRGRGRSALVPLAAAVGATVLVLIVRQAVYDAWLPATMTAKGYVADLVSRGQIGDAIDALKEGLRYEGTLMLVSLGILVVGLGLLLWRRVRVPPLVSLATLIVVLDVTVTSVNSGDWMPARRLLVPVLPLLLLILAWTLTTLVGSLKLPGRRGLSLAAGLGASVLVILAARVAFIEQPADATIAGSEMKAIGGVIAQARPAPRVITNVAGAVPYYAGSDVYFWDILGLTDRHNARYGKVFAPRYGRTDPRYDYSRDFDLFVSNSSADRAQLVDQWSRTPGRFDEYVWLRKRWTDPGLALVARRGTDVESRLRRFCGCREEPLSGSVRRAFLEVPGRG
jgi:arabinofuranosyltransferase